MRRTVLRTALVSLTALALASAAALAQAPGLALPPSGDNQHATVTQYMGLVSVTVDYNSPDVTGPNGQSRKGHIWGELVPWGLAPNSFGTAKEMPWRAGANENTTITVSHDVEVQGKPLAAGTYGLHIIPQESGPWTVIFSNNSTSWGSFFYDPAEDALRVEATPKKAPYQEWLTYAFTDRQRGSSVLELQWEELALPIEFTVPDSTGLYITEIKKQMRNSTGFTWQNINNAAQFLLTENRDLETALEWAQAAISAPFIGQENFTTLSTLAGVEARLGKLAEAQATVNQAVDHPTATPTGIHQLGRAMLQMGQKEAAMAVFQKNYERFDGAWPTEVGLMRGYSAMGDLAKALEHAKKAYEQAPDPLNKGNLERLIKELGEGKPVS